MSTKNLFEVAELICTGTRKWVVERRGLTFSREFHSVDDAQVECGRLSAVEAKRKKRNARARMLRVGRREMMQAAGLTRGRDSMGREIWE